MAVGLEDLECHSGRPGISSQLLGMPFILNNKVRIKMRPCWIRVGAKSNERLHKRQKRILRHREEGVMKTEVGVRMM